MILGPEWIGGVAKFPFWATSSTFPVPCWSASITLASRNSDRQTPPWRPGTLPFLSSHCSATSFLQILQISFHSRSNTARCRALHTDSHLSPTLTMLVSLLDLPRRRSTRRFRLTSFLSTDQWHRPWSRTSRPKSWNCIIASTTKPTSRIWMQPWNLSKRPSRPPTSRLKSHCSLESSSMPAATSTTRCSGRICAPLIRLMLNHLRPQGWWKRSRQRGVMRRSSARHSRRYC